MELNEVKICVIGLGYVGLPLAVEFARKYQVVGFDINRSRIEALNEGHDNTLEVADEHLAAVLTTTHQPGQNGLVLTDALMMVQDCNIYIVTVPTPVDRHNRPDLTPLVRASETVGKVISHGDIVIYESTVYPGCTEQDCIPVVEKTSGLTFNTDFFAGYSPERINPGDKEHTVTTIRKVTSGSTPETGRIVDSLYSSIITAGTHLAPSIMVAEMAKVIENSQRDINIAFVNEIARICFYMGLDTQDVLNAAGTKWNFLKFRPGLVGGHCIGVDPYYLAQKAEEVGYHPEIILAGRRMNDGMAAWVAARIIKLMISREVPVKNARVLVLGITFKENCPDIRNSKVADLIAELREFGCRVDVYDPWADPEEVLHEYGIRLTGKSENPEVDLHGYDTIVAAVAHQEFATLNFRRLNPKAVIFDLKGILPNESIDGRL
jgi:UDP-N-acetyl-D-galactosamine dehydrogenase